jgi:DNA-binding GntR family transcriptional regulator
MQPISMSVLVFVEGAILADSRAALRPPVARIVDNLVDDFQNPPAMLADDRESPDQLTAVVSLLQEEIVVGRLAPGERLVEEELADRLQTKRHVLRQAFVELERYGLIERKRNRGATVRKLTMEDVSQIYAVREILEQAAAAAIRFPLTREQLAPIEAAQRSHEEAVAREDAKAVFRANFEFHCAIFSLSGNPYLTAAIEDFRKKTHVVWSYTIGAKAGYFKTAQREHRAILRALRQGDRETLLELCSGHLNISRTAYLDSYRLRLSR